MTRINEAKPEKTLIEIETEQAKRKDRKPDGDEARIIEEGRKRIRVQD